MSDKKNPNADLAVQIDSLLNVLRLIFIDPLIEIYRGIVTGFLPDAVCWIVGISLSLVLLFHWDRAFLSLFNVRSIPDGKFRAFLGIAITFSGFIGWAYYRMGIRAKIRRRLKSIFLNAGLETRLKETPEFVIDVPVDEFTRRLRLRGRGLPVSSYRTAKDFLETGLNVTVAKIENPSGNRELVDIIYTTEKMPEVWHIDHLMAYKDFSFPVGRSYRGEIKASFKTSPHFLVAGESGGGKSSFIRMMITILVINNQDLEIHFIDFKRGMENQVFEGFDQVNLIDDAPAALKNLEAINNMLEDRMKDFKRVKATNLDMFNAKTSRSRQKLKRILVVVDEVSEMMPTVGGQFNGDLSKANAIMNRIARMGRAVGINLVIGVQKPDAKNLDTGIKANTSGVVCFPVSHFNQSMVVLGNGRAAELNSEYKGRAIWKQGSEFIEVQTPLMTEKEVNSAREQIKKYWRKSHSGEEEKASQLESGKSSSNLSSRSATSKSRLAMEITKSDDGETPNLS